MDMSYFQTLAAYNRWANRRLYAAVAQLPPGEFEKERPAFFRSIRGVLNHVLVGDRIWLGRMEGRESGLSRLDAVPSADLAALRSAREAEDARIEEFAADFDAAKRGGALTYTTVVRPATRTTPWPLVFGHFFNHQTHHRGQAHDLLSQTPVAPPPLDFLYFVNTRR